MESVSVITLPLLLLSAPKSLAVLSDPTRLHPRWGYGPGTYSIWRLVGSGSSKNFLDFEMLGVFHHRDRKGTTGVKPILST